MRLLNHLAGAFGIGFLAACSTSPPIPTDSSAKIHSVRVVSNGWHTSIVVGRDDVIATGLLLEAGDFPHSAFLEIGWGDREYFPAKEPTFGMALKAAFWATPAVIHLAGYPGSPEYSNQDVERLLMTQDGYRRMISAISNAFIRSDRGRADPFSPGLYWNSYFYDAQGDFYLFNTCNTWAARMLRAGGVDLEPTGVITANDLMTRLRAAVGENTVGTSSTHSTNSLAPS